MNTSISIRERLFQAEDELLTASIGDATAKEAFRKSWTSLVSDFSQGLLAGGIDEDTAALGHATSSRVSILSNHFIEMETKSNELSAKLQGDIDEILVQPQSSSHISSPNNFTCPTKHPCPPYIPSAYKWLRHNLHRPYPSVEEVNTISANSDTNEKKIRNWFISARQRMGWTKIAKQYFHSDKEDTADAAYRALIEPDPKRPIDATIMFAFVKMQVAAESMYSTAFKPSLLASSLGTTVVEMSAEHKARIEQMRQQAIEEENVRKEVEYRMKRQRASNRGVSQKRSVSLYPSPERSSGSSPEPTLVLSETEENEIDITLSSAAAGRKRRRSSSPSGQSHFRAGKRLRTATVTSPIDPSTSLPSPSASVENILDNRTSSEVLPVEPERPASPPTSRMRRLSDAEVQGTPKRPRGLVVVPHIVAGSDPQLLPSDVVRDLESQNCNWSMTDFELDFDVPSAVTSQPLDPSEPLDVEFFNNWANDIASPDQSFSRITNAVSPIEAQQIESPASQLPPSTASAFDLSDASTDYNQMLHILGMPSQSAQPKVTVSPPSFPTPVSSQSSESTDLANNDWSLYLEPGPSADQPNSVSSSGQSYDFIDFSNIPDFDPAMLKPPSPPSPTDVIAQNAAAAKRAKLGQWRAHIEAAKKLEEELTAS